MCPMVKESESVTFRVPTSLLESLRRESLENHTSLNTLVNQIIIKHETWGKYFNKAEFMSIPKDLQKSVLSKLTKNEIIQIAQQKSESCKDVINMLRSNYSLDSFLDVIEAWCDDSNFHYRKEVNENKYKLTVQHTLGENWSIFLSTLIQSNLEKLTDEKCVIEITTNTIIITVPKKSSVILYSS